VKSFFGSGITSVKTHFTNRLQPLTENRVC
jgi:hypothetical protein